MQIVLEFLYQFIAEIHCYGTGRGLLTLSGTNPDRHETLCTMLGFAFWILLGFST